MIPVSVIVCTKNEAARIASCLRALQDFDEVIVLDSHSDDGTCTIAGDFGARIEYFTWNGRYPKKYQWALDNLTLTHERILFVDADEVITPALKAEIAALDWRADGYFIKGQPVWRGHVLGHGLWNNKLALFKRHCFRFPVVDDLMLPGSTELEGHYQPCPVSPIAKIGQLQNPMQHDCLKGWKKRHAGYATWEAGMIHRDAFPADPLPAREMAKSLFRRLPMRGAAMFWYSYLIRRGFLDGMPGLIFARAKARYYRDVTRARKALQSKKAA